MDNLVKALNCFMSNCEDITKCWDCPYYQPDYDVDICLIDKIDKTIDKITALQKSNRNWRRKTQRLRKEIKELKGG